MKDSTTYTILLCGGVLLIAYIYFSYPKKQVTDTRKYPNISDTLNLGRNLGLL